MKRPRRRFVGSHAPLVLLLAGCNGQVDLGDLGPDGGTSSASVGSGATSGSSSGTSSGAATGSSSGAATGWSSGTPSDASLEATVATTCPASIDFHDGTTGNLAFGPGNQAFTGLISAPEVATNYEMLQVYPAPNLAAYFEQGSVAPGPPIDPTIAPWLPDNSGDAAVPGYAPSTDHAWIGELSLVPPACAGTDVTGRTITVHFFVPLLGAVPGRPPNGAALGSYHGQVQTAYSDAMAMGVISTLSEFVFSHTFTAQDAQDVAGSGIFLRVFAFGYDIAGYVDGPIGARLYVNKIVWQ
jgi:hypothetical protein